MTFSDNLKGRLLGSPSSWYASSWSSNSDQHGMDTTRVRVPVPPRAFATSTQICTSEPVDRCNILSDTSTRGRKQDVTRGAPSTFQHLVVDLCLQENVHPTSSKTRKRWLDHRCTLKYTAGSVSSSTFTVQVSHDRRETLVQNASRETKNGATKDAKGETVWLRLRRPSTRRTRKGKTQDILANK